jgi:putative colanic acid biosynthesis UDP-glucose lipid carrier transferase
MTSSSWIVPLVAAALSILLVGSVALIIAQTRFVYYQRPRNVAIMGLTPYGRFVLDRITNAPDKEYVGACLFDDGASARVGDSINGVPLIKDWNKFRQEIRKRRIDEIWLTLPLEQESRIHHAIRELSGEFVELKLLPDVRQFSSLALAETGVLGMPTINLVTSPPITSEFLIKAAFDRLFSACVLVPLLPVLIVLAVAVKLSSPGPILFRQRRKGTNGREFDILKFRTMQVHHSEPGIVRQASRSDARITRVGSFLRRTSLDELPQFFNVLFGQMSVVGPRPHAIEHDDFYRRLIDSYMYRYRVRPGITGWAQVNGFRGETRTVDVMVARVKFDLFYIQNWNFWFDMKIIMLTIVRGFSGRNAF